MGQIIIHVDMDAFYASVEVRDDPSLEGKPVIIGSLPTERGVVATCSYEAREFGVHSAMNIKEAYRLCPNGIYLHPNFDKYKRVSEQLHELWGEYASASEYVALDEAYLDVTETAGSFEKAAEFAHLIKQRTKDEIGLSCSVGVAYSKSAAKTASEEMKPNGYFEIRTPQDYVDLVIDRDVSILMSVGKKTTQKLHEMDIITVRDLYDRENEIVRSFGKPGEVLVQMAHGMDDRKVVPYNPEDAKSISREITFQEDVYDYGLLNDVLLLLAISISERSKRYRLHGNGIVLKITYSDMKSITKSKTTYSCNNPLSIRDEAVKLLASLKKRPVRLIGLGIFNLSSNNLRQTTLDELFETDNKDDVRDALEVLHRRYQFDFSGNEEHMYRVDHLHKIVEHMRVMRIIRG